MKSTVVDPLTLPVLHRRTVAVQMQVSGLDRLLKGRGVYERDRELGHVLRIKFPAQVGAELLLTEDGWEGQILPGSNVGCDYLIRVN